MTEKEIINNNKLIAKFMGWKESPYDNLPDKLYKEHYTVGKSIYQFKYHSSWDELILVLKKIELLNCICEISFCLTTTCRICILHDEHLKVKNIIFQDQSSDILPVYCAIIEYIKFYNTQH